jgi:hypothetical protein
MSSKAMAAIVAAVAFTAFAARNGESSSVARSPHARPAMAFAQGLPSWHPPVVAGRLPPGHPPVAPQLPRLPEGHPPIPWLDPGCPAGAAPVPRDGMEREGDSLRDAPPVIST